MSRLTALQGVVANGIGKSTPLTRTATELVLREWSPQECRAMASPIVGVAARRAKANAEKRRIYYAVKARMQDQPVGFVEWLMFLPMLWKIVLFIWEWWHRDTANQAQIVEIRASMGIVE